MTIEDDYFCILFFIPPSLLYCYHYKYYYYYIYYHYLVNCQFFISQKHEQMILSQIYDTYASYFDLWNFHAKCCIYLYYPCKLSRQSQSTWSIIHMTVSQWDNRGWEMIRIVRNTEIIISIMDFDRIKREILCRLEWVLNCGLSMHNAVTNRLWCISYWKLGYGSHM